MSKSDEQDPPHPQVLYLIRHGESEWNAAGLWQGAADPPLSPLGLAHAEQVAGAFADLAIDVILSSPQERARETAAPLARAQGLEIGLDPALAEIDVGSWSGLSREQIEERAPGSLDGYRAGLAPWEGGESYAEHEERAAAFAHRMESISAGRTAAFSHGGTIRAIAREMLGVPHELRHRFGGVGNAQIVELERRGSSGQWTLVAWATDSPRH